MRKGTYDVIRGFDMDYPYNGYKTYIKKDDTTQRLKKFGTLLPK
jgi:hypothetical protein